MNTIILLVGASGCGKSTVAGALCKAYGLKQVESYTTRPPRYDGEGGHVFVTEQQFDQLTDLVGFTQFCGYRYCATAQQVEENDIYVIDPDGVKFFREKYNGSKNVVVVEIIADEETRKARMMKRGDSKNEINRRILNDETSFSHVSADIVIRNDNVQDVVRDIHDLVFCE